VGDATTTDPVIDATDVAVVERVVVAPYRVTDNQRAVAAARRVTADPFTTPTTSNQSDVEEVEVCWLCGGTPCDWLEYSGELLQEIDEKISEGQQWKQNGWFYT
jgi:hypothetical protein